jgi:beta-phosphoglucomutase-like phosphatase (HAD superfamily)
MIQGLIFDFDGLILNTEETEYAAWEEIFQEHGAHLPEEDWALSMGIPADDFDVVGLLEQATGLHYDRGELKARARRRFLDLLVLETTRPGVKEYLQSASTLGLPVALATSSRLSWVEGHLQRLDLWDYFKAVCTAEDVIRVKPDPALFLLAASRLSLNPVETIVFEDSLKGVQAAKAAGCYCVAVPHRLSNLDGHNLADRVITSMSDTPLEILIEDVNRLLQ